MKRYEKLYHAFATIINYPDENLSDFIHHVDGREVHAINLGESFLIVDKDDNNIMTIHDDQSIELHDKEWCNEEHEYEFVIIDDMEVQ